MPPAIDDQNQLYKQQAAERAVDFVQSGMVVGLGTGSTATSTGQVTGGPPGPGAPVVQHVTVNEVAQDPQATAFAVASRLAADATR